MVKFSKQIEAQLVPEWKEAFVDYSLLKKDIKKMKIQCSSHSSAIESPQQNMLQRLTSPLKNMFLFDSCNYKHETIQVHKKLASSESHGDLYKTELLDSFKGTDVAGDFFARIDLQLNKVNHFYIGKENGFVERNDCLKKKMEIILDLKAALKSRHERRSMNPELKEDQFASLSISCDINDCEDQISERIKSKSERGMPNVNMAKLRHAEKMVRGAYIELFSELKCLRTYRNLNILAFVKILKKFDKVMGKQILPVYLKVVEGSYFNGSDKAVRIMDEVEDCFTKYYADGDKRKAMMYLKPREQNDSHIATFFIGLFTGSFISLFIGYCIMAHIAGMYTMKSDTIYMETAYPVLSMFSLLFLHLFLYGVNVFMWRKKRINYSFIFEFIPTKELKCRDIFLICAISMTLVVGIMFAHLSCILKGYNSTQIQSIPGILLLMFGLVLVCPFNIMHQLSRRHFLKIIRNIMLSPFYKVVMVDFFVADQLCSQIQMLRNLEYLTCYYVTGSYKTQDYRYCMSTMYFRNLAYAVSFIPYYWRAMQCARRWFDEGEMSHLINMGKYVSAMIAAGAKVAYEKNKTIGWLSFVVGMSSTATLYQLYWDFVKDWGLLQPSSKNPWLRNELILRHKYIYFLSMGLNFILRLAWIQSVLHTNFGNLDYRVTTFILATLEVIRRGHWNFYRLENEHLNNVGKFRDVKTVPLPFLEMDQS